MSTRLAACLTAFSPTCVVLPGDSRTTAGMPVTFVVDAVTAPAGVTTWIRCSSRSRVGCRPVSSCPTTQRLFGGLQTG
jgi:hypothetical protein